jgi:RNA polymerase sigma-70 factor (ECF subfamily)
VVTVSQPYLVQAAKAGDSTAFERLLRPEYRNAYRLAYAMLHDTQEAEDAVQEAALKAWRKLGNLRRDAPLGPWFLGIVANQCRGAARARWTTVVRLADPPTAREEAAMDGSRVDLRRALGGLGHDQRLILVLRYYLDLPYDAIASTLKISSKAARRRVERALDRLRSTMTSDEGLT